MGGLEAWTKDLQPRAGTRLQPGGPRGPDRSPGHTGGISSHNLAAHVISTFSCPLVTRSVNTGSRAVLLACRKPLSQLGRHRKQALPGLASSLHPYLQKAGLHTRAQAEGGCLSTWQMLGRKCCPGLPGASPHPWRLSYHLLFQVGLGDLGQVGSVSTMHQLYSGGS